MWAIRRNLGYLGAVITLAALFTYPVKSCRGTEHKSALLEEAGLAHDREWMFVTSDGRFLTQREEPSLARVDAVVQQGELRLSADGAGRGVRAAGCRRVTRRSDHLARPGDGARPGS